MCVDHQYWRPHEASSLHNTQCLLALLLAWRLWPSRPTANLMTSWARRLSRFDPMHLCFRILSYHPFCTYSRITLLANLVWAMRKWLRIPTAVFTESPSGCRREPRRSRPQRRSEHDLNRTGRRQKKRGKYSN